MRLESSLQTPGQYRSQYNRYSYRMIPKVMGWDATRRPGFDTRWERCKTELHVLRKGKSTGVPSINDLAVDGM